MRNDIVHEEIVKTYNKISGQYVQINFEPEFWLEEFQYFEKLIPGKRVIDFGCGTGRDAILFTMHGYDYLGIDASSGMLKIARKKANNAKFKKADLYTLGDKFQNFDGFWAAASLLHVPKSKIKIVLRSLRKTIKNGGAGFIALKPKLDSIDEQWVADKRFKDARRFFAYYKVLEFKKLLAEVGFKVVKTSKKLELPENKIWLCFFVKK
ncbi:MAG TPA: class I SAM-dependent methyltransferase [Candidatus Paceibacterota bacterium]|nr:class I SAM-dependent methyltransferase [Candidatus Paceibacterota bacterium]